MMTRSPVHISSAPCRFPSPSTHTHTAADIQSGVQCVELGGFDACLPVGASVSTADTTSASTTLLWGLIGGEDADNSKAQASGSYNRLADALIQGRRTLQEITNTLNIDNRTFGTALELLEGALCDSFLGKYH